MFAHVTHLRYWKSEYTEATCQDDSDWDIGHGLFAIADGVSTAILSDLWANILVNHALKVPLLSTDPFEVEWWLRLAQKTFQDQMPDPTTLSWSAQSKINTQGSYSTLATLRISEVTPLRAQASLLAFGDSCIFIARPHSRLVRSFPLQHPSDFTIMPISLPSLPGSFQRNFHRCATRAVTLTHKDTVILATDAVAQWIMNGDYERDQQSRLTSTTSARIHKLLEQTPQSWPLFIAKLRKLRQIVDDDSTAMIITFRRDPCTPSRPRKKQKKHSNSFLHRNNHFTRNTYYQKLGSTTAHTQDTQEKRKDNYYQTLATENRAQEAVIVGDAIDLRSQGIELSDKHIAYIHSVADAMNDALYTLQHALNTRIPLTLLVPMWERCSPFLQAEPCAHELRNSLRRLGLTIPPIREPALSSNYTNGKGEGSNVS